MIIVALLVLAASLWLCWEWRSGALTPPAYRAESRRAVNRSDDSGWLPTAAALNADAAPRTRLG